MAKLENITMNKAFFLDRDGVIIKDKKYLSEIKEVRSQFKTLKKQRNDARQKARNQMKQCVVSVPQK